MGVGAYQSVEAGHGTRAIPEGVGAHHRAKAFHVELMADALTRRHDLHVVKGGACPLEKGEALGVAGGLDGQVLLGGSRGAGNVCTNRVIHHQHAGDLGIHTLRVAARSRHGIAHSGEVHKHRHAGEVLEEHPRRHEVHLVARLACQAGCEDGAGLRKGNLVGGSSAHHVFQQAHQGMRQT